MGRDDQLGKERDVSESRQEAARRTGRAEAGHAKTGPEQPSQAEQDTKEELLKSSGGDPLTQESD